MVDETQPSTWANHAHCHRDVPHTSWFLSYRNSEHCTSKCLCVIITVRVKHNKFECWVCTWRRRLLYNNVQHYDVWSVYIVYITQTGILTSRCCENGSGLCFEIYCIIMLLCFVSENMFQWRISWKLVVKFFNNAMCIFQICFL